jgi:2-dehydro-3-deoxyphosphogluconate aldolase/(4S)-4-hydroxy-2-oxoglutarate aldolase
MSVPSPEKEATLQRIKELGLIAVIRGPTAKLTLAMVDALVAGGVQGIEITYTTPEAAWVVQQLCERYGEEILPGMGTLTRPEQVEEAGQAGARFVVSPHYEPGLARAMVESGLLTMLGAFTPSEVWQAFNVGSDVVKIFPASVAGPEYIKALHGPFPEIPMMPTGGVTQDNLSDWFAAGVIAVGAGSNLCPPRWAKEGRFKEITQTAEDFVKALARAREGG